MAKESSVSLSTVSLRLIKQPEHRPEFEKKLAQELREALDVPETTAITTMPDSPSWWQRAKTIAEQMEAERKYAEEHPECAKSPNGKHEWRFGTCVWCGKSATEIKTETPSFHVKYIDLSTGKTKEKTIPEKEQIDLYKQQREGKISIISIKRGAIISTKPEVATTNERPELIKRLRDAVAKLPTFTIKWADVDKMSASELRDFVEHVEKQEWTPRGIEQLTEAKREEIIRLLNYLIADEIKAQEDYRRLLELLPEHRIKILEILGDEETHEKELRQILMHVTSKVQGHV